MGRGMIQYDWSDDPYRGVHDLDTDPIAPELRAMAIVTLYNVPISPDREPLQSHTAMRTVGRLAGRSHPQLGPNLGEMVGDFYTGIPDDLAGPIRK